MAARRQAQVAVEQARPAVAELDATREDLAQGDADIDGESGAGETAEDIQGEQSPSETLD